MKILQRPISDKHKSALFFDGVIATHKNISLVTFQIGEIVYKGKPYEGKEIRELATSNPEVNDELIDAEVLVDVYVEKYMGVAKDGIIGDDEPLSNNYDEAIDVFIRHTKDVVEKSKVITLGYDTMNNLIIVTQNNGDKDNEQSVYLCLEDIHDINDKLKELGTIADREDFN